jgi:Tfp pilus assembly protein PilO
VSDTTHGAGLLSRIVAEHRRTLVALGMTFVVGVLTYAFVVYPLAQRVANIEQRDRAAERSLAAAQAELSEVSGTLTGKAKASGELATFYNDVLPQDLSGARRLTYLRLARLAREANLDYERSSYSPTLETDSTLTRLGIQMVLSGTYANIRTFIYELETAPEFVVIDNIQLSEGGGDSGSLVVSLELSTYYRGTPAS